MPREAEAGETRLQAEGAGGHQEPEEAGTGPPAPREGGSPADACASARETHAALHARGLLPKSQFPLWHVGAMQGVK